MTSPAQRARERVRWAAKVRYWTRKGLQYPWCVECQRLPAKDAMQSKTPKTDELRAKFDQDWQTVLPTDEAAMLAANHTDAAMTHAHSLELALGRRDALLRDCAQFLSKYCGGIGGGEHYSLAKRIESELKG